MAVKKYKDGNQYDDTAIFLPFPVHGPEEKQLNFQIKIKQLNQTELITI